MTLSELQEVLAEIPADIPVSRYVAHKEEYPRVVWNETNLDQSYSSNGANDLKINVVVEFLAKPDNKSRFLEIVQLFRDHEIPFTCPCGYDEDENVVSYEFNIMIEEAFPNE